MNFSTKTIVCKDCGKETERTGRRQMRCSVCAAIAWKVSSSEWAARNSRENIEYNTVKRHHYMIFRCENPRYKGYKGMPFFDGWDPEKGGSFEIGANWIKENLGCRPEGKISLDIVHHEIGFMPGNLRWSEQKGQLSNQMRKVITRLKHENDLLKKENEYLKSLLIKKE